MDHHDAKIGRPDRDIPKGEFGTVSIVNAATGLPTGEKHDAKAMGLTVKAARLVAMSKIDGVWLVAPWE